MFAGVLHGVRVLDLTRVLAGPFGSMLLGDLGAEIIKIESPGDGDPTRHMGPTAHGSSAYFIATNRNKKGITLDLRTPEGQAVFHDLVRVSDVVLDNFRPGILPKLAADYGTLRSIKRDIICCSITGYGTDGPYAHLPAFDLAIQAQSGGMSVTGEPGRPPVRSGLAVANLCGGIFAATAVSAALYHREKTGEGRRLDLTLMDTQVSMLAYMAQYWLSCGIITEPVGSGHPSLSPYEAYRTKDGYVVIAVLGEKFWHLLCDCFSDEAMREDPRFRTNNDRIKHRNALTAVIEDHLKERTTTEWVELLRLTGVPCAPVNDMRMVFQDPQLIHRGLVAEIDDPTRGIVPLVRGPFSTAGGRDADPALPPDLGEHTDAVLTGLLGYDRARVRRLRDAGII